MTTFHSPEAALRYAYGIRELRFEPKNATLQTIERLQELAGLRRPTVGSDYTPQEHLAYGVMILALVDRTLADQPLLLAAVRAEYSGRADGAAGIRLISEHVQPSLAGAERLLADWFVMRQCRGNMPRLRWLSDRYNLSPATLSRRERLWREAVGRLRHAALDALQPPMDGAGITSPAVVMALEL